jgi:hypothetical protein
MHEAISYLQKRIEALSKETDSVLDELSKQVERESKTLESMEYGRDFDEERSLLQEKVVEVLQDSLEALQEAQAGARDAAKAFDRLKPGRSK